MGVLDPRTCKPRKEVLKGDLDDAIFAADFGDLINGDAPKVYGDAKTFFQNTYPAKQLCKIIQAVCERLAATKEGGTIIRLSTGFGGGKTHTLMALWHLAENIDNPAMGTELLPAAGRPDSVIVVAIDAGKAGVPEFASHGKVKVHSLWGEVFWRLGREKALKALGKADDPEASPNDAQIASAFPEGPVLILLDELVIYMAKLSDRGQGNLLGFLNSLTAAVNKRPQTVLIVTDPAGQVAYASQAATLGAALQAAAAKLDDIYGRKVSDFDPIGEESAQVIARRLFERIDPVAAQAASATYHSLYERVLQEMPGAVPAGAATADYAKRIVQCYPFHPRLLDTARNRLGGLQDFQKSRGVLRLFARILRDVSEAGRDLELITAGDIDWASNRIQADLLDRLDRREFKAAIAADIDGHARELDGGADHGIHHRIASALLLESIPMDSNSGFEPADLTLAVLQPDEAGPEPAEAMDRLMGVCWHTYPTASGRGCQFRYQPNVLKQIEERMTDVPLEDARSRVLSECQSYFQGMTFKPAAWPTSAKQVSESAALQLALCETEDLAKAVCAYADNTDPAAPMPRGFQNAILAITATPSALNNAIERAQRLLAAEAIEREHKGESGRLVREQLKKILPTLTREFRIQTRRAFDRVVLPGGAVKQLDERYLVADEEALQKAKGQTNLKRFLDDNKLIYQPGDSIDTDRFIKNILPGTTPLSDRPEVYTAKHVHERFLAAPGLRLIPDGAIVRQTILKSVQAAKVAVRLSDGKAYDNKGCVAGAQSQRRRVSTDILTTLSLDDSVWIALADSEAAQAWLKEDDLKKAGSGKKGGKDGDDIPPPPPPPPPGRVVANTWEQAIEYAVNRPLLELHFVTESPSDAAALLGLAQPLGPEQLTVSVTAGGSLKDGGTMNFAANDLKPNHPAKPLTVAQTVFNSLADGGMYEADMKLSFGNQGRGGMVDLLRQASEAAPEAIKVKAWFEKPTEGN